MTNRIQVLLLVLVGLLLFYPLIYAPLCSVDDSVLINRIFNTPDYSFWTHFFSRGGGTYYRPLLILSFYLDYWFSTMSTMSMHLENVLLHIANASMLFWILSLLRSCENSWPRFFPLGGSLLFLVHPITVEPVAWISGRTDVLAGFFLLLAITVSCWMRQRRITFFSLFFCGFFYLCACLSKEVAVFFLPLGWLLFVPDSRESIFVAVKRHWRNILLRYSSYIFAGVTYFSMRYVALQGSDHGSAKVLLGVTEQISGQRLVDMGQTFIKVFGFYVKKIVWPWPLNFTITGISEHYFWFGCAVVVVAVYALLHLGFSARFFLMGSMVLCSALLVIFAKITWMPVAERYLYVPALFWCPSLIAVGLCWGKRKLWGGIITVVCLVFALSTIQRVALWQDNLALFRDAAEKSPNSAIAINQLALALVRHGHSDKGYALLKENAPEQSLRNREYAVGNRAQALVREGKWLEARQYLRENYDEKSRKKDVILKRLIEVQKKIVTEAGTDKKRQEALELIRLYNLRKKRGDQAFYAYIIGREYFRLGEQEKARAQFKESLSLAKDSDFFKQAAASYLEKLDKVATATDSESLQ